VVGVHMMPPARSRQPAGIIQSPATQPLSKQPLSAFFSAGHVLALEWKRYDDPSHGMSITYPSDLFPNAIPTEGGVQFSGGDAVLALSAMTDPEVNSTSKLRDLMSSAEGYSSLTYSPVGKSWLVASGYRGEDIYYEKFFVLNGEVRAFSIE
jgi:hypothetical protein